MEFPTVLTSLFLYILIRLWPRVLLSYISMSNAAFIQKGSEYIHLCIQTWEPAVLLNKRKKKT